MRERFSEKSLGLIKELAVSAEFPDLAKFLCLTAPRWVHGHRSLTKILTRRLRLREATRGRRLGICHVSGLPPKLRRRAGA